MIFSEKEIYNLKKENRVALNFTGKTTSPNNDISLLASALNYGIGVIESVKNGVLRVMEAINSIDKKIDTITKTVNQKPKPAPEKKPIEQPEVTGFKIIRDLDNRIQKIEVIRSK